MGKPDNDDDSWGVDDPKHKPIVQPAPLVDRPITQSRPRIGTLTFGQEDSATLRAKAGRPVQREEMPPLPDLTGSFTAAYENVESKPKPPAPAAVVAPPPLPKRLGPKPKEAPSILKRTAVAMRAVSEEDKHIYLQHKAERESQPVVEKIRPSGEYPLPQPQPILAQAPKRFWRRFFLTRWFFRLLGF